MIKWQFLDFPTDEKRLVVVYLWSALGLRKMFSNPSGLQICSPLQYNQVSHELWYFTPKDGTTLVL